MDNDFELNEIEFEVPDSDGSHVVLYGVEKEIELCGVHLYYREGEYYQIQEDGNLCADWCLTWFYENRNCPEEYFYFEQDPPETAIHNLRNILH